MFKKLTLFLLLFFSFTCFAQEIVDWESTEYSDHYLYSAEFAGKEIRAATDELSAKKLFVNFLSFDPSATVILSFIGGTNVKLDGSSVLSNSVHVVDGPHEISFDTVSLKYSYVIAGETLYETEALSFGMNAVSDVDDLNKFYIYPNPSIDGNLKVLIPQNSNLKVSGLEVLVFSSDSKIIDVETSVDNDGSIQIDLASQPAGLYILVIKVEDQIFRKKIIKG
jgi:hypothetical protein